MASAMSMATSVSASRWRTAWNEAMGRPNWMRPRACSQASSSMARDAPTSSWATASRPRATAAGQSAAGTVHPGSDGLDLAGHLEQAEVGVDALDRPQSGARPSAP